MLLPDVVVHGVFRFPGEKGDLRVVLVFFFLRTLLEDSVLRFFFIAVRLRPFTAVAHFFVSLRGQSALSRFPPFTFSPYNSLFAPLPLPD